MRKLLAALAAAVLATDETALLQVNNEASETFSFDDVVKSSRGQAEMVMPAFLKAMGTDGFVNHMLDVLKERGTEAFLGKHTPALHAEIPKVLNEIKLFVQNQVSHTELAKQWVGALQELKEPELLNSLEKRRQNAMEQHTDQMLTAGWNHIPKSLNITEGDVANHLKYIRNEKPFSMIQEGAKAELPPSGMEQPPTSWCPYANCLHTGWVVWNTAGFVYTPASVPNTLNSIERFLIAPETAGRTLIDPAENSQRKIFQESQFQIRFRMPSGWIFETQYRGIDFPKPWVYSYGLFLEQPPGWPGTVDQAAVDASNNALQQQTKGFGALLRMSTGLRLQPQEMNTFIARGGFEAVGPLQGDYQVPVQEGSSFYSVQVTQQHEPAKIMALRLMGLEDIDWKIGRTGLFWITDTSEDVEIDPEEDLR